MAVGEAQRRPAWALQPDDALEALDASPEGLDEAEAERRLDAHGRNEIAEVRGPGPLAILLAQFRSPLIYILLLAAAVTIALDHHVDAAVIGAVLALNAAIGFTQELRAQRSMDALRRLSRARARVVRAGAEREVDAAELVPGDVVLLEAGAKVPADARILHAVALEADESLLTGESAPVAKSAEAIAAEAGVADRTSMLLTGTVVTRGHGRAVVVATGPKTELGIVAHAVEGIGDLETPLQRRMARFAHVIGIAVLAASAVALVGGLAAGEAPGELFLAVVALAVAAIPEGLPVVLTIVLAVAVRRMAARRAIVRRLPAVETLGSCSVIGSDKTGTLTENRMTVERIVTADREYRVTGRGYETGGRLELDGVAVDPGPGTALHRLLLAGALCNDAIAVPAGAAFDVAGDPTEIALVVAAAKAGLYKDELEELYVRRAEIPFDSTTRFAATVNESPEGALLFVKGAPEEVLARCVGDAGGRPLDRARAHEAAERMAADGLRVLALALRETALGPDGGDATRLRFLGLVGMKDPPRREAADAIAACRAAGIRVLMVTGDHAGTAAAIAQELGIPGAERRAVTGLDLDRMGDEQLRAAVRDRAVFARVSPTHKYRIVLALQANGETVAVTGDGVNDAPALKAADIGAAMGRSGTDVAKEAADMVVTDDNFATIAAAVEEGRVAFDNVRKATFFLISTGAAAIVAVLASILFRFPLPFLPAQLLWLNLVTNGIQDMALAFEPGEKATLRRPPRPRGEGVVSRVLWERTAVAGVVMALGTLALFLLELRAHDDLGRARTVALTTMVLFQVIHVGNARSEHLSAFAKSPFSNRFLFVGTAAALAIHAAALYVPATQFVLRLEPLDGRTWVKMALVALTVLVAVEAHKRLRREAPASPDTGKTAIQVRVDPDGEPPSVRR